MKRWFVVGLTAGVAVAGLFGAGRLAHAEVPLQSTNYKFQESSLGAGGMNQSSSANFKAEGDSSAPVAGDTASSNFQSSTGTKTTPDPTLSFSVNGNASFSDFSATAATVTTSTFSVTNYTSYGYIVQIAGSAPSSSGHTITPMATTGTSQTGIEQFGINLAANTAPSSFGANPNQTIFGAGVASSNYNTPNNFRYVSGETIASAPKSSGQTTYTISYLINVAGLTPGGNYTSNQTLIVTGTY